MTEILKDYFDALERLTLGKPRNVPSGTKINNDSVSQEAGRKKGTIKKSRPIFAELIIAIKSAAALEEQPSNTMREQRDRAKADADRYRILWEEALAREVSLIKELWDLREEIAKAREATLTGKVTTLIAPAR